MFTYTKPSVRHITPDNLNGRSLVKVVYVVLEPQYQSALSAAVRAINDTHPKIAIEISGYLIEELRDDTNYEAFKVDVARANVFIASLIFLEDLADKIVAALRTANRRADVIDEGIDAALRVVLEPLPDSTLLAVRLSKLQFNAYATQRQGTYCARDRLRMSSRH